MSAGAPPVGAVRTRSSDSAVADPRPDRPVVLVTALGEAHGARAAGAALACAAVGAAWAPLFIDLDGRPQRPTLIANAATRRVEERLSATLPGARVAARGGVCHLAVGADPGGFATLAGALDLAPRSPAVVHVGSEGLRSLLATPAAERISGALVLGEAGIDRALGAPILLELLGRGFLVALLGSRPGWVSERRAMFGALPAEDLDGFPPALVSWFVDHAARGRRGVGGVGRAAPPTTTAGASGR